MIFTCKVSRLVFFLLFILTLSISTVASTTQAATTTTLRTQRTHSSNISPLAAGTVTEFPIPTPGSQPVGITSGPCGDGTQCLWFTESYGNKIGKITTSGQIIEYSLPSSAASAEPEGITSGPCGDGTQCLWFTEFSQTYGNNIGKITPGGRITLYPIPTAKSEPESITSGPCGGGNNAECLWFTEFNANQIGSITPDGQFNGYSVPTPGSEPTSITLGPDGNLWFTEFMGQKIGQVITSGSQVELNEYKLPATQLPSAAIGITPGPDGKLWFSLIVFPGTVEALTGTAKIGQIDPSTHQITESQPLPDPQCLPNAITIGSDKNLWFTEYYQIGKITTDDQITEYPLPAGSNGNLPDQITSSPVDGNLWFTEFSGNNIGRITVG